MSPRMTKTQNSAVRCLYVLQLIVVLVTSGEVTGPVNGAVTLPCVYRIHKYRHSMCWGRGGCPSLGCPDEILRTDGYNMTWRKSDRYQLLGHITQGDVSLTITGATKEDEGTYCCRVAVPGLFNDMTEEIKVMIEEVQEATTPVTSTSATHVTTPRDNLTYTSVTPTTWRTSLTSQWTKTPEKSEDHTIPVLAAVGSGLILVALMGVSLYLCKNRSRKTTKTESTMSVINMEALTETRAGTIENIYS
ncbi:hypothetical protein GDO81_011058 [Engystomops pustulosus]|uniref:Ig-like domain-containing protein n=1 Tax=Engystomops pustulosus TaxID=76066 RepID=A0AAV7C5C6_ENGPU|nr:hypothetical protein GDO81_011058 [Engystomops pustulosus]